MNIFFGGIWGSLSTLFLIGAIIYIVLTIVKREDVMRWKSKVLSLLAIGLLLCIFVVMRDDYVSGMQGGMSLFAINSLQINLCYLAAAINGIIFFMTLFIKKEKYLEMMFYTLSMAMIFKILIIEVTRIFFM